MSEIKWFVVICREGVTEVTPFEDEADARAFLDISGVQWTEAFLCKVVEGPKC